MTNPGGSSGLTPTQWGVTGTDGSIPAKSTQTQSAVTQTLQDQFSSPQFANLGSSLIAMITSFISSAIGLILGGFETVIDAIFGTVTDPYVASLPTINDHSNSITTLTAQFDQLILQGLAIVFTSNNTYTPSSGTKSIDVIIIGAGAGGGAGYSGQYNTVGGQGGGGGGEVHTNIPASLLPVDGSGNFTAIAITIGAAGSGGATSGTSGGGGGDTTFGSGAYALIGGGGQGGVAGGSNDAGGTGGGTGGAGMIIGGAGGVGECPNIPRDTGVGGDSHSAYDLHGGGGGGGGGGASTQSYGAGHPAAGGVGGISAGGAAAGGAGTAPSSIVATGGGGGGGGYSNNQNAANAGGAGAYPAGGGGGGASDGGTILGGVFTAGGNGGNGILYIIEHTV